MSTESLENKEIVIDETDSEDEFDCKEECTETHVHILDADSNKVSGQNVCTGFVETVREKLKDSFTIVVNGKDVYARSFSADYDFIRASDYKNMKRCLRKVYRGLINSL